MASFCSKCGSPVSAGAGFCPSCGAPVAANEPMTTPVGYAPVNTPAVQQPWPSQGQYPPTGASYPNNPPGKSGGALKIVLIVIAAFVGLFVMAAGIVSYRVYRVVHNVSVGDKGDVSFTSPTGGITLGKNVTATDAELGVPVYPGATRGQGGMRVKNKNGSMITVVYKTNASVDDVVAFYKNKMPGADETSNDSNHATVLKSGPQGDKTMVTVTPSSDADNANTSIMIMRIVQPTK